MATHMSVATPQATVDEGVLKEEAANLEGTCYPVMLSNDDGCELCEYNDDFSEYYGEPIWLCSS